MSGFAILLLFLVLIIFAVFRYLHLRPAAKGLKPAAVRLGRIQTASWWFLVFMGISFLLYVYIILAFLFGWPPPYHDTLRIIISHNHIYTSPGEMPQTVLLWWSMKTAISLFFYWVMFSLFRLYQKGILFSARNVRHIKSLGYFLIVNWAVDYQLQSALKDMDLSTTPVFIGLLIIFIAWIMDEGRKIQEEQALTV